MKYTYICIYIYTYIFGFTSKYLQLLLCTSCTPKKTLGNQARINERMQNLMNTMATSKNSWKIT